MIKVVVNSLDYQYDVHSLVSAFYPGEQVKVYISNDSLSIAENNNIDNKPSKDDDLSLSLFWNTEEFKFEASGYSYATKIDLSDCRVKDQMKYHLYKALSECTGKELPWGNMIGVRPVKMASKLMEEGKKNSEIALFLREKHQVSLKKSILAVEIANREAAVCSRISDSKNGISIYIGIPFCPTTCLYCSFTSYPICSWEKRMGEYLETLKKEIIECIPLLDNRTIDTIYIGGGTPTSLNEELFGELLDFVTRTFDFTHVKEFTVEAGRADSITKKKLELMLDYGVDRISINPQTMQQKTLNLIGRAATVDATVEAFKLAREVGHDNINMDLILGLPGETLEDFEDTMKKCLELDPDSITVHSLAIKKASKLYRVLESKTNDIQSLLPSAASVNESMEHAYEKTREKELYPYYLYRQKQMSGSLENVGFAKENKEGLYNIIMMEEVTDILAFGPGTVSKRLFSGGRIERCDNVKDIELYIEKIGEMVERKKELFLNL